MFYLHFTPLLYRSCHNIYYIFILRRYNSTRASIMTGYNIMSYNIYFYTAFTAMLFYRWCTIYFHVAYAQRFFTFSPNRLRQLVPREIDFGHRTRTSIGTSVLPLPLHYMYTHKSVLYTHSSCSGWTRFMTFQVHHTADRDSCVQRCLTGAIFGFSQRCRRLSKKRREATLKPTIFPNSHYISLSINILDSRIYI